MPMDGYTKGSKLGEGDFGTVFKCTDCKKNKELVKKVIAKSKIDIDCNEIKREVEIMEKLIHPNAVQYLDSFADEKRLLHHHRIY